MTSFNSRNVVWRYPSEKNTNYSSCSPASLGEGLVLDQFGALIRVNHHYHFRHLCSDSLPVLYPINRKLTNLGFEELPVFRDSWSLALGSNEEDLDSEFRNSIYPILYSVTCAAVISVFLTAILFTKHYLTAYRPTILLKVSSLAASCQLMAIYVFTIIQLSEQLERGESGARLLLEDLLHSTGFNVAYLVTFFLVLLTQVSIIQRMFPRRKEKKIIVRSGIVLVILSQIIWAVSTFLVNPDLTDTTSGDDSIAILPAFMYLLRISISVLYSCLVNVYLFSKRNLIFKKHVFTLTITMIVGINTSIAFFIADISNVWVSELSEVFNLTCYIISNITSWEWLNRMSQVERHQQKEGVLGRQFFDYYDENYDNSSNRTDENDSLLIDNKTKRPNKEYTENVFNLKSKNYEQLKTNLRKYRQLIVNHPPPSNTKPKSATMPTTLTTTNNEVYIYSPKQISIEPISRTGTVNNRIQNNIDEIVSSSSTKHKRLLFKQIVNHPRNKLLLHSTKKKQKSVIKHNVKFIELDENEQPLSSSSILNTNTMSSASNDQQQKRSAVTATTTITTTTATTNTASSETSLPSLQTDPTAVLSLPSESSSLSSESGSGSYSADSDIIELQNLNVVQHQVHFDYDDDDDDESE